ncbi:MAG: exo-alpha-sialidase [Cyclobacteriaceae bacterium]
MIFSKQVFIGLACASILFSCTPSEHMTESENGIAIISDLHRNAHSTYLTKNNHGQAVLVWTEQDTASTEEKHFYFSIWNDSTGQFADKIKIPLQQNAALHTEGMPKVGFKNSGDIIAIYEIKVKSEFNPYAGEIHYIVSGDHGKSWTEPQLVHTSKAPHTGRAFFDMITLSDGEIGVSWLGESHPDGGRPVLFAKTNAENLFINETIVDSMACECCRTAIYADQSGSISIVYRDIIDASIRDISVSVSEDYGKSFSKPLCFSGDAWNISGCPHNGPDVISNGANIFASWFTGARESGVYFAKLNKQTLKADKRLISKNGRNIQLAEDGGKVIIVFNEYYLKNEKRYSTIRAVVYPEMAKTEISGEAVYAHSPVVIACNNGKTIISWIEKIKGVEVVKYKNI